MKKRISVKSPVASTPDIPVKMVKSMLHLTKTVKKKLMKMKNVSSVKKYSPDTYEFPHILIVNW